MVPLHLSQCNLNYLSNAYLCGFLDIIYTLIMKKILIILGLISLTLTSCQRLYVNHKSPIQKQTDWWVGEYHMIQQNGVIDRDRKLTINKTDFHISYDSTSGNSNKITDAHNSKIISKQTYYKYVDDRKVKTTVTITITPDLYHQIEERWVIPEMTPTSTVEWKTQLIRIN